MGRSINGGVKGSGRRVNGGVKILGGGGCKWWGKNHGEEGKWWGKNLGGG